MMWPFTRKQDSKFDSAQIACLNSFMQGFELGLDMASEFDDKVKSKIKQDAIAEALLRLNGNHKKIN